MSMTTDWIGPDRWKIKKNSIDSSQISSDDMADEDFLTITGLGGGGSDKLERKHTDPVTQVTDTTNWGSPCHHDMVHDVVGFSHHNGLGNCYLQLVANGPKNVLKCYIGDFEEEGPPTGAAWTAEDQN